MKEGDRLEYKIDGGRFFERSKKTTNWLEARKYMNEKIENSRKKSVDVTFYYNGEMIGAITIDNPDSVSRPKIATSLTYENLIKKAINDKSCAFSKDNVSILIQDELKAEESGDFRKCNQAKIGNSIYRTVLYVNSKEREELKRSNNIN